MRTIVVFTLALAGVAQAPAAEQRTDKILIQDNPAGTQTVEIEPGGAVRVEYSYNDRGRGDHIIANWKLDADGLPIEYESRGNDYMKAAVEEHFEMKGGKASWKNRSEKGNQAVAGKAFYLPLNAPQEFIGVLARALLKAPGRKLALLPAGETSIEEAGKVKTDKGEFTEYRITGLSSTPQSIWLDREGTAASVSSWFSVVPEGLESAIPQLLTAQEKTTATWSERIARVLAHQPSGDLVIRNARLFDPRDLSVTPGISVLVRGDRIVRVGPDAGIKPSAGAEIIDAKGRFLMPGLWDNHQHLADSEGGALDIANGVTSARDMANDTDTFPQRVARYDDGSELGPRVLKAGIIDGTGEFAGPTKMRADTAEKAIELVDWHADHGYVQIKIYSSIKPELVPIMADRAHARGMRVSGHVPAFMSARQFVENGADEIQHFNFIELNFLFPEVKETRNRDRFIKVAEHAREFTPDKPAVREFIKFLKEHHTVLDPTMNIFEGLFCGDPSAVTPGLEDIVPRFPAQIRRSMRSGALEVPADKAAAYREAFPAMLRLLKAVSDAGITIIPGTDALPGYSLHHELELYVRAGIPAPEVLRMATLTPSQVMGVTKDLGIIAAGKLADMVLIDGDPAKNIRDTRNITTVIKGGKVYDPAAIEKALGIALRQGDNNRNQFARTDTSRCLLFESIRAACRITIFPLHDQRKSFKWAFSMNSRTSSKGICLLLCACLVVAPTVAHAQQKRVRPTPTPQASKPLSKEEQLRRDQQQTVSQGKTVGTGIGAVIGGILGGLIGAATGDRNAAVQGAAAGMIIGGTAGYSQGGQWGQNVARKKMAYARTEDKVDLRIERARSWRQAAQRENQSLRAEVTKLDQQSRQLRSRYAQQKATRNELAAAQSNVRRQRAELQQKLQTIASQIATQRQLLTQGQKSGSSVAKLQELNGEIQALSAEKAQLEARNKELQQIDNRLGI